MRVKHYEVKHYEQNHDDNNYNDPKNQVVLLLVGFLVPILAFVVVQLDVLVGFAKIDFDILLVVFERFLLVAVFRLDLSYLWRRYEKVKLFFTRLDSTSRNILHII